MYNCSLTGCRLVDAYEILLSEVNIAVLRVELEQK